MNATDNKYRSSITWFLSGVSGNIPHSDDNLHLARFISKLDNVLILIHDHSDMFAEKSERDNSILKSALDVSSVIRDIGSGKIDMSDLLLKFSALVQSINSYNLEEDVDKKIDKSIRDAFCELILLAKYSQRADFADEVLKLVNDTYHSAE